MLRVILHNTISLNGALSGFDVDMDLHYGTAAQFKAGAYVVGSSTVLNAGETIPPEKPEDFIRHEISPDDQRPYWVVVDSKGQLQNVLHYYRRMEYIRDILMLISFDTPSGYVEYLKERNYEIIQAGDDYVDYKEAFDTLRFNYNIETILLDSGSTLTTILLQQGLVDEISLVIAPVLTQEIPNHIFSNLELQENLQLRAISSKELVKGHRWLRYEVVK